MGMKELEHELATTGKERCDRYHYSLVKVKTRGERQAPSK